MTTINLFIGWRHYTIDVTEPHRCWSECPEESLWWLSWIMFSDIPFNLDNCN